MIEFYKRPNNSIIIKYKENSFFIWESTLVSTLASVLHSRGDVPDLSYITKIHEITYGEFKLIAQLQPNLTIYRYLALLNKLGE